MEKREKYFLQQQTVFVHSEAQQQKAVKQIVMYWCFRILYRRDMVAQLRSVD